VGLDGLREEFLAEVYLGFGVIRGVTLVFDDFESQVVQRAAHVVEPVFRLHDDFVEALLNRPVLLLLGKGAEEALAAPVAPCAANPCVHNTAAVELDVVTQAMDQIDEFRLGFRRFDFVCNLEGHRHDR
jgi:hypothetical protein